MASEEVELLCDRALPPLAQVDVEVEAGSLAHLNVSLCAPGRGAGLAGRGDGVAVRDLNEDRAPNLLHPGDRAVQALGDHGPCRDFIAPGRTGDGAVAGVRVLAGHRGDLPRRG